MHQFCDFMFYREKNEPKKNKKYNCKSQLKA